MRRRRRLSSSTGVLTSLVLAGLAAWGAASPAWSTASPALSGASPAASGASQAASAASLALGAAAPSPGPSLSAPTLPPGELTVFAAASLADVLGELEQRWLERVPQVPLAAAFDGSNVLAAQIAEGADVDVFLSADRERPMELAAAGLTTGQPIVFARNRPVIVTPLERDVVEEAVDIAGPGVRLVAALPGVPITRYAEEAVAQLAAKTADPAAFSAAVQANIVSREDNVRAALAKVELGEGDAAIVYVTDARASELVREVPFPEGVEVSAEYAAVQVSTLPAGAAFIDWLRSPEAIEVLAEAGFEPPA